MTITCRDAITANAAVRSSRGDQMNQGTMISTNRMLAELHCWNHTGNWCAYQPTQVGNGAVS